MTRQTLRQALIFAEHGWPVFPCQRGQKIPATTHGFRDATTEPEQITHWFARHPDRNLAVATGTPGPDVLDVDQRGQAGNGFAALNQLRRAGLLEGASAYVRTPSGGLHAYFTGTSQRNGHLAGQHLDFRSAGGYVLVPPSEVDRKPYQLLRAPGGRGELDWATVTRLLQPSSLHQRPETRQAADGDLGRLAAWMARQEEGNRNAGLFWAANRALEANPAVDLSPLAVAARQAGLDEPEIERTLDSARKTGQDRPFQRDHQAEAAS
jgi:hypothetical protein